MLNELTPKEVESVETALHECKVAIPDTNIRIPALMTSSAQVHHTGNLPGYATNMTSDERRTAQRERDENEDKKKNVLFSGMDHNEDYEDSEDDKDEDNYEEEGMGATDGRKPNAARGKNNKKALIDDFPDSEIHDRIELKMMSLATVEREIKKARKQQLQQQQQQKQQQTQQVQQQQ